MQRLINPSFLEIIWLSRVIYCIVLKIAINVTQVIFNRE